MIKKILLLTAFVFFGCLKSNTKKITKNEITIEKIRKELKLVNKNIFGFKLINSTNAPIFYKFVNKISKGMNQPLPYIFVTKGLFSSDENKNSLGNKIDDYLELSPLIDIYDLFNLFNFETLIRPSYKKNIDNIFKTAKFLRHFSLKTNALAVGLNHSFSFIDVGINIINSLTLEELKNFIAHEMSHIKHYDTIKKIVVSLILQHISNRIGRFAGTIILNNFDYKDPDALKLAKLSDFLTGLVQTIILTSYFRKTEKEADLEAVKFTETPEKFISGLNKFYEIRKEKFTKYSRFNENIMEKYLWFLSSHPTLKQRTKYLTEAAHNLA